MVLGEFTMVLNGFNGILDGFILFSLFRVLGEFNIVLGGLR